VVDNVLLVKRKYHNIRL